MDQAPGFVAAAQAAARAEHGRWAAILDERTRRIAAIEADESPMYRRMAVNAVALEIAQALHLSESQVWRIVAQGERLRDRMPQTWAAFGDGLIDAPKASTAAIAIDRCQNPETIAALDQVVADYAPTHTVAELRRRLDKLIDRLEPIDIDAAEAARAERRVTVDHQHDGMSWMNAHVPSAVAIAALKRLKAAARQLPDDGRTHDQKIADLYASWLTNATGTECDIKAEIAVIVEAEALAGVTDTNATIDDEATLPVSWLFDLAENESSLWLRLLTDPRGHVLDVTQLGYQPSDKLRRAIQYRDMTCRVAGCRRKAVTCDLDHEHPYGEGGETNGCNLRCLCRRHHGMKGHGLLPDTAYRPPEEHVVKLTRPPIRIELYEPAA